MIRLYEVACQGRRACSLHQVCGNVIEEETEDHVIVLAGQDIGQSVHCPSCRRSFRGKDIIEVRDDLRAAIVQELQRLRYATASRGKHVQSSLTTVQLDPQMTERLRQIFR